MIQGQSIFAFEKKKKKKNIKRKRGFEYVNTRQEKKLTVNKNHHRCCSEFNNR